MKTSTDSSLRGSTVLVTGSGKNIGRAVALSFAQAGANVITNGHKDYECINSVAEEARQFDVKSMAILADVSDPDSVRQMVDTAYNKFGSIDILVSNVGVRNYQAFCDISIEDWRLVMETNLFAAFYLTQAVTPKMTSNKFGRIIFISGVDGFAGHMTHRSHNVTAKAGLQGLAKSLARELASEGITCNTVVPGVIDTSRDWSQYPQYSKDSFTSAIPVGRLGYPEEIAQACLYLAGSGGAFVNGQAIHVNGGEYMF